MLSEKFNPKINQEKRKKTFSKLNLEEVDVLHSSDNAEFLSREFDRIFLKLLRLIKYSQDRNNQTKSEIEQNTGNLLKKFLNFVKNKAINLKIKNEQAYFFDDFCYFINFLEWDSYFTKIHNSIPHTSLEKYMDWSVWEQFFHNAYGRERWLDKSCEWWSCSYRTILLYNIFSKLKEAWIDMDIRFYRYKNLDDEILKSPTMRHSGLIINFQWKDYIVDYDWISLVDQWKIVKPLDSFIDVCDKVANLYDTQWGTDEQKSKIRKDKLFFQNFRSWKQQEMDYVIFFDNVNDFLEHVEKFPENKKVSLYVKFEDRLEPVKFDFVFTDVWVQIGINDGWHEYILKDNKLGKKDFIKKFIKKIWIKRDTNWLHYIDKDSIKDLELWIWFIKDKVNTDKLQESYSTKWNWESWLVERDGEKKVIISKKV